MATYAVIDIDFGVVFNHDSELICEFWRDEICPVERRYTRVVQIA